MILILGQGSALSTFLGQSIKAVVDRKPSGAGEDKFRWMVTYFCAAKNKLKASD